MKERWKKIRGEEEEEKEEEEEEEEEEELREEEEGGGGGKRPAVHRIAESSMKIPTHHRWSKINLKFASHSTNARNCKHKVKGHSS